VGNRIPNRVHSGHFSGMALVGGAGLGCLFNIPFPNREVKVKSIMLDMHFEIAVGVPLFLNIPEDDENLRWWLTIGSGVVGNQITKELVQTAGLLALNMWGESFRLFRSRQYFFDSYYAQHLLPMEFYIANLDPLNNINVCATVVVELEDVGII